MPNWVSNIVTPKGSQFEEFKAFVKGEDEEFDFNKVIPMPTELNITAPCGWETNGFCSRETAFQKEQLQPILFRILSTTNTVDEYVSKADDVLDKSDMKEKVLEHYRVRDEGSPNRYHEMLKGYWNKEKYGYTDWYNWSIDSWGCKWNASDSNEYGGSFFFNTPWSTPEAIYKKLAERFDFDVMYADEDIGSNFGIFQARNGSLSRIETDELTFGQKIAFCNAVANGIDYDYDYEQGNDMFVPDNEDINFIQELYIRHTYDIHNTGDEE